MIYGREDPQNAAPVTFCIHCGGEIYAGEPAYMPAEYAGMVCEECLKDWLYETYVDMLGVRCNVGKRNDT